MSLRVLQTNALMLPMHTRMPFRYGIATVRQLQHLIMNVLVEVEGVQQMGVSADHLAPRWFVKDPNLTYNQEVDLLLQAISHACECARDVGSVPTPFALWQQVYKAQIEWARTSGIAPLLASFGVSLVERAVIDAFCRASGTTFAQALRQNSFGIELGGVHPLLMGKQPCDYLPKEPLQSVIVRHTVGLSDPLRESDVPSGERLHDGLPQSLQACIRRYRLTHFKIKLGGDAQTDHERLRHLAQVLDEGCRNYCFTLDANEMYPDITSFRAFWHQIAKDSELHAFLKHLLFVEQPLHRDEALSEATCREMRSWDDKPPMIIDESDAELTSLPDALRCGYNGCSAKSCKGVFKAVANACLIEHLRRENPHGQYILSGEDLTTVPPVALLQDLALMANLGIEHVERNGYHYFAGLTMLSRDIQEALLLHHPDLFERTVQGLITIAIRQGKLSTQSVCTAPFGLGYALDPAHLG